MITSLSNQKIKHLVELQSKSRTRNKEGLFIIEGIKMFLEADNNLIKEVYLDEVTYTKMEESSKETPSANLGEAFKKLKKLQDNGTFVEIVTTDVFKKASDTQTPQGVIAVIDMMKYTLKDIMGGNILILEDIQDPGNLGTMLRTAEGAGVSGILMSKGTVDIFNPKTIRSTMGSLYRVPFYYTDDLKASIGALKDAGVKVYAAHLKGTKFYDDISYEGNSAFLIGNEGNGLSDEIASLADVYVKIPMEGRLESLNASIAAALLMYQAR